MPTPRELAKLLWPEFGTVFLVDFIFSVCVIMFALAACISAARTTLFKAKLAEVINVAEVRRIDIIETLALTGELEQVRSMTETRGVPANASRGSTAGSRSRSRSATRRNSGARPST